MTYTHIQTYTSRFWYTQLLSKLFTTLRPKPVVKQHLVTGGQVTAKCPHSGIQEVTLYYIIIIITL